MGSTQAVSGPTVRDQIVCIRYSDPNPSRSPVHANDVSISASYQSGVAADSWRWMKSVNKYGGTHGGAPPAANGSRRKTLANTRRRI